MMNLLWENLFRGRERKEVTKLLRENYLFLQLGPGELNFLEDFVHSREYRSGEFLFKQGDIGLGMYIISSGVIEIAVGPPHDGQTQEEIWSTRLKEGDFMGEIALTEERGRRTASAKALEDTTVVGFFKSDLMEITKRRPSLGAKIYGRLAQILGKRLKETTKHVIDLKRELLRKDV